MLDVALLGTGGMMPLPGRFLTSLLTRLNGKMLLIDCGESTQISLKLLGWGFKNIDVICFTHFHADHISGLPGLLLTIGNSCRTEPITIIGPQGLRHIVESLCVIAPELPFAIEYIEIPFKEKEYRISVDDFHISTLLLNHGVPCYGYSLEINRAGKFDLKRAEDLQIPKKYWSQLQSGNNVSFNDKTYFPSMVLGEARKGIKISYLTDSRPTDKISDFIMGSDLFICEGLYGDNDKKEKAKSHHHMIFSEAALIAKKGMVEELWLTHFSPAMTHPLEFIHFATEIFPNTKIGFDRMNKTIYFKD